MKNCRNKFFIGLTVALMIGCADNTFDEYPLDDNFPLQLVLDAEEGSDLAQAEDVEVEFNFADRFPGNELPNSLVSLDYSITDLEGDMEGNVVIDKIIYEVELDDCTYERELDFESDGLSGTINITPDIDLGSVPESFQIIFTLPGLDETEGGFAVAFSNLKSSENIQLGYPNEFKYEVLDNDVAGEWELEITSAGEFESFKEIFGPISPDLMLLNFEDITGKVQGEFEFEEMKFVVELAETEEITTCEDGESETEEVNKEIEIEADYSAEEGEVELEGSHPIINDAGLIEDEIDFIVKGEYSIGPDESIIYKFFSVVDEDNFSEGEELFRNDDSIPFTFVKE